jgi:hypothetical protein
MKNTYSGGYVGIFILFVGVAVLVFLAAQQYQKIALRQQQILRQENSTTKNADSTPIHPIDRALDAKAILEVRDRTILNE